MTDSVFDTWEGLMGYLKAGYYRDKDSVAEDVEFYIDIAEREDKVLELGCGTGRILLELIDEGIDAYGIDVSEEVLDVLRRRAEEKNIEAEERIRIADMQELSLDEKFSLIIVPSNNFLYNLSTEEQVDTLENIREHLTEDGRAVFDFYATGFDIVCEKYGEIQRRELERDDETYVLEIKSEFVDEIEWVIEVERRAYREGEKIHESTSRQKHVPKTEFELLLEKTGFEDWTVYGDYDYEELVSPEQQMVWIVEK